MTHTACDGSVALTSWILEQPFTHAFTIMPGVQSFSEHDVRRIAQTSRHSLKRFLFGRREPSGRPWFVAIAECSRDRELWHLHGCVNLLPRKAIERFERGGKDVLDLACRRHHGVQGIVAEFPSVKVSRLDSGGSIRFLDYANKRGWEDVDGLRLIL